MSKFTKLVSFINTERGRILCRNCACAVGIGLFMVRYVPHTLGISKYKEFVQGYKHGYPRHLPSKIVERFERAIDLVKINKFEKKFLKPFVVTGFDLFHAGSTKSRFGGLVGIPGNYFYESYSDIEKDEIKLCTKAIDWTSDHANLLQEAVILTEDEQVFGMATEILQLATYKPYLHAVYPAAITVVVYTISNQINMLNNLYARPLSLRLMLYFMSGLFGYGLYTLMTDVTTSYYSTRADEKLAELGPDVIDAGIRFYDKQLKKNIALRHYRGDNLYTSKGNINYMVRNKSVPLTTRKLFFEKKYKGLENTTSEQEATI